MLQIHCLWCGQRDEKEFTYGGDAHVSRPSFNVSEEEWAAYLFNRDNPKGIHYERWVHSFGCGRWFNMARDTVTHVIYAVYEMGEPKPQLSEEAGSNEDPPDRSASKMG